MEKWQFRLYTRLMTYVTIIELFKVLSQVKSGIDAVNVLNCYLSFLCMQCAMTQAFFGVESFLCRLFPLKSILWLFVQAWLAMFEPLLNSSTFLTCSFRLVLNTVLPVIDLFIYLLKTSFKTCDCYADNIQHWHSICI